MPFFFTMPRHHELRLRFASKKESFNATGRAHEPLRGQGSIAVEAATAFDARRTSAAAAGAFELAVALMSRPSKRLKLRSSRSPERSTIFMM
jgi:hypothetical protein